MQNGRINSPSLDLACPQAKAPNNKYVPKVGGQADLGRQPSWSNPGI